MPATRASARVEYTALRSTAPDDGAEDEVEPKEGNKARSPCYLLLFSVLMALAAIGAAAAFHLSMLSNTVPLLTPKEVESSLRLAQPSPNLEKGRDIMTKKKCKFPQMVFPRYMTRANSASPDTVYQSGSAVVLSPADSMIYYWKSNSKWPMCYLAGWVSATHDLIEGNKSYPSEGDLATIEVWNLTIPANPKTLKAMTWNTRPARVSLLGTVNFTSVETQRSVRELDGQELRAPTPRFPCLGTRISRLRSPVRRVV
ncbi:hypothetical protein C8J57DRAFT_1526551 [Mycena rebaudengoi]|nr:hypothetical protein C8J57DRAFT_1527964 [Mycena rebaudengoi]KAJ7241755.1 hypothetical protein C8J57DRAFT_1526551 [Mycena rebaudengoi]